MFDGSHLVGSEFAPSVDDAKALCASNSGRSAQHSFRAKFMVTNPSALAAAVLHAPDEASQTPTVDAPRATPVSIRTSRSRATAAGSSTGEKSLDAPVGLGSGSLGVVAGGGSGSGLNGPAPTGEEFSAAVTAATTMFGDPTRRRIYLFARENPRGVTASQAAEHTNLHPNVARHHLDKLAAGGYLDVVADVTEGRSGRPSKRYRSTGKPIDLEFPARRHDLIVSLLSKALELLPDDVASTMAEEVGQHYGRELAMQLNPGDRQRSMRSALHTVADALTAHGFAAHTEAREGSMSIVRDHCPFGDLSASHPVICAVDRGMVRGMLAELYGETSETAFTAMRTQGDDTCVSTST
jgi:predicted ArsR family transcriptional regulator